MQSTRRLLALSLTAVFIHGCQLVKVQEYRIDQALKYRTQDVVNSQQLSVDTVSLLKILSYTADQCLKQFEQCTADLYEQKIIAATERYSALAELYLAQAKRLDRKSVV